MASPTPPTDSLLQSLRTLPQHIDRKLVDADPIGYAVIVASLPHALIQDTYEKWRPSAFDALAIAATVKSYEVLHHYELLYNLSTL